MMRARASAKCHARGVDGDPAAAPLLGDVGRGAGAAGGVEHEVAGVGGHEDTALNDFRVGLNATQDLLSVKLPELVSVQTLLMNRQCQSPYETGRSELNSQQRIRFASPTWFSALRDTSFQWEFLSHESYGSGH